MSFLAFVAASFLLVPFLGRNFFPSVDTGQILMHVRGQVGTRVEESSNQFAEIQKTVRRLIPPDELATMVDNIGMPISGINMAYNNTGVIGPQDGDIQIKLKEGHRPTEEHVRTLREELAARSSPARRSHSCPPISSARSSISARPHRSTSRSAARTWRRTSSMPTGC